MSDEKKSWLDRAGAVHLWKTIEAMLGTKVDKIEGFGLSSNDYTTEEKKKLASLSDPDVASTENNGLMSSADKAKLDGIEAGANNYTHPVYEAKQAGLYRISVDNTGHVATADKMTSEELTAEGVSPADHTHDLGELVDTLETSADAVEDANTVMVGAIVTSDDGSATTKYTRRPLAALWNWIKAKADTLYAAVGHTHNYAGSTEPGGDALNAMKLRGCDVSSRSTGYQNVIPAVGDDGVIEVGKYVDFHAEDIGANYKDYNVRMIAYDDGTLDVVKAVGQPATITANLNGTANFATETQIDKEQTVDLSSLDTNTWYPVVTNCGWPGLHHIKCNVQLNSGTKPSWSTHSAGFTAVVELLTLSPGWGTTGGHCICLCNDQRFISDSSKPPVGYTMMWNGSMCVFWLRGGGIYHLYADYKTTQSLQTSSYTNNEETVSPTTSYPGISINRSTITADINGNATIATTGVRDYNNANNTIKIGWSGADLDANTLAYVAGYTSDMKIHTASKDGVRSWLGNGVSASGQNYVRFDDGTQICQGSCGNNSFSSFGAAFANTDYRIGMSEWKSSSWENYAIGGKSTTGVTLRSENNTMEYIAIGRWK